MSDSEPRIVDLPGQNPARLDANMIACARMQSLPQEELVIVHTYEGFAFALVPEENQGLRDLYNETLSTIWPDIPPTKPKKRRRRANE